ncbi:hypothetical protein [Nostoc sp. TCL240-02]|uniref:hypothetical protein n=1 Tax=Nostoc sp. TCL240-02 TaxID=2572090 RepID=UPI00157F9974|nr:hypothetical protein [Nostoc sp. TCL240-02]
MEPKVVISAIADITTVPQRNNGVPHSFQERSLSVPHHYQFLCEYEISIKVSRWMKL